MSRQILPGGFPAEQHPEIRIASLEQQLGAERARREALEAQAQNDPMTGLLNKEAWKQTVEERIKQGGEVAIALLDLFAFKSVNDDLGPEEGDRVIVGFSNWLDGRLRRESEVVTHERYYSPDEDLAELDNQQSHTGRLGGDEFGILVDPRKREGAEETDRRSTEERMVDFVKWVDKEFSQYLAGLDETVRNTGFNLTIGWAVLRPGQNATDFLREANQGLKQAKHMQRLARVAGLPPEVREAIERIRPFEKLVRNAGFRFDFPKPE